MDNDQEAEGVTEQEDEKRPPFKPVQALPPIALMGLFIIITIGLSLVVGPLYDSYGLSSGFEDYAESEYWYLYAFGFLGLMIAVAVGILLLRKLFKRRKLKLKYLFAIVVFTSTLVVIQPLLDTAFNGAPPRWDEYEIDIDGMKKAFPLDPEDVDKGLIIYTDSSFCIAEGRSYHYEIIEDVKINGSLTDPQFNNGLWVISELIDDGMNIWTVDPNGTLMDIGLITPPVYGLEPEGANIFSVLNTITFETSNIIMSIWTNETDWRMVTSPFEAPMDYSDWTDSDAINKSRGPYYPSFGWTFGRMKLRYSLGLDGFYFHNDYDDYVMFSGYYQGHPWVEWIYMIGDEALFYEQPPPYPNATDIRPGILFYTGSPVMNQIIEHEEFDLEPNEISFTYDGTSYNLLIIRGAKLYNDHNGEKEEEYLLSETPIAVFQEEFNGKVWLVFDGSVISGHLEDTERGQLHIQIISFLIAGALVAALLIKPKWWLVDLGGMLMGAGVIAIMGISFPLPFTILLLVLLAVYDFISVYKTKHMIALADSVVEAKMPILLVFPMKWSYRYEDETNLMDPKRKRESLFMGLGDVIIPGILILSAASFLSPVGGIRLLGFIYPPVAVALFALVGMLIGWGSLMFFVIKGKAHAGLPPINSGTILGFIIGMLVVYGTIVFW